MSEKLFQKKNFKLKEYIILFASVFFLLKGVDLIYVGVSDLDFSNSGGERIMMYSKGVKPSINNIYLQVAIQSRMEEKAKKFIALGFVLLIVGVGLFYGLVFRLKKKYSGVVFSDNIDSFMFDYLFEKFDLFYILRVIYIPVIVVCFAWWLIKYLLLYLIRSEYIGDYWLDFVVKAVDFVPYVAFVVIIYWSIVRSRGSSTGN